MSSVPSSFSGALTAFREEARLRWRSEIAAVLPVDEDIPHEMPPYFADRYAYRLFRQELGPGKSLFDYDLAEAAATWRPRLEATFVGLPEHDLPAPRLDSILTYSPFAQQLLGQWRDYLRRVGIDFGTRFQARQGLSWSAFFRLSAHYPRLPAIRGPRYFYKLSPANQQRLLRSVGPEGVFDFFIVLQQVHEESHLLQGGEPMLCEFVHAVLWCRFLSEHGLWRFQFDEQTGRSCNTEKPWVERFGLADRQVAALYHDTAAGVCELAGPAMYDELVDLAHRFDSRRLRYRAYLETCTCLLARLA